MTNKELRILSVSVEVSPHINEEALAENIQRELRNNELFEGPGIEFGTVDVYQHNAHSGSPEELDS